MDRAGTLKQIMTFGTFCGKAFSELAKFSYDCEAKFIELSNELLADTLTIFLSGSISAGALEEWANFIECRDDIDYSKFDGYIYTLANPEIMGDINHIKISRMLKVLNA